MSSESPASVLYSSDGYELAAVNGSAIPSGNRGLLIEGSDGTNSRFITVDTSGRVTIVGAGVAGTPAGGIVSMQGVSGGTPLSISSGAITTVGSTAPTTAVLNGALVVSSAPTYTAGNMNSITLTTAGALRIDGSATTQPVSGTVTANAGSGNFSVVGTGTAGTPSGGVLTIQGSPSGTPIPISGSITATNAAVSTTGSAAPGSASYTGGNVTTSLPTYTNNTMNGLSLTTSGLLRVDGSNVTQPVSIASSVTVAQSTAANLNATVIGTTAAGSGASSGLVTIQGNASGTPVPVSGTVTANNPSVSSTGAAPPSSSTYIGASVTSSSPTYTNGQMSALSLTTAGALRIDGSATTQPISGTVTANAGTGTFTVAGTVTANAGTGSFTVAQATASNLNATVVGAGTAGSPAGGVVSIQGVSGGTALPVVSSKAATSSLTQVSATGTTTTLLSSNPNRLYATIYNTNPNGLMYIALSSSASTTSFTIALMPKTYWEIPTDYTGAISALWASPNGGAAVITELTV